MNQRQIHMEHLSLIHISSLYLKNLNNITQEMQLEILKRDKLDYTFQSLSLISIVPMLALEPIKNWSMSQLSLIHIYKRIFRNASTCGYGI